MMIHKWECMCDLYYSIQYILPFGTFIPRILLICRNLFQSSIIWGYLSNIWLISKNRGPYQGRWLVPLFLTTFRKLSPVDLLCSTSMLLSCNLISFSIQLCAPHSCIGVSESTPHETTCMQISNLAIRALNQWHSEITQDLGGGWWTRSG